MLRSPRFLMLVLLFSSTFSHPQPMAPCSAPEYHQLDFWVGDWDVFESGKAAPVAHVTVDRILDGCALHEHYQDAEGHRGQSFSAYDAGRRQWRQSWYTNRGKSLEILGGVVGDSVILAGTDYDSAPQSLVRGTWQPRGANVQETAVTSDDGGKTWKPWFDLAFRPALRSANEDRKQLLQLDAELQAAVKANDVAALQRLLPEDFVLIGSSGKAYHKADMLAEARSGDYQYGIQEDTEQNVRIWGDTAVITAKLHAKGTEHGLPFDYFVLFSDTYTRTSEGWRYVFGQACCHSTSDLSLAGR